MKLFQRQQKRFQNLERDQICSSLHSSAATLLDDDEESSLDSCEESCSQQQAWMIPLAPERRRVQFCEDQNRTYESELDEDMKLYWFSDEDIAKFKRDAQVQGRLIASRATQDPASNSWYTALSTAHQCLHNEDKASSLRQLLEVSLSENPVDPYNIGLEKWVLPGHKSTRIRVRESVYAEVQKWQANRNLSAEERARQIARTCRTLSRSSKHFAICAGHVAQHPR